MYTHKFDIRSFILGWSTIGLAWSVFSYGFGAPLYLLPPPHLVALYLYNNASSLLQSFAYTLAHSIIGFTSATVIGLMVGVLIFHFVILRQVAIPLLITLQTIPVIAIAPLITFWLGYGFASKCAVSLIVSVFPIIIGTLSGMREASPEHLAIYRTAGVSPCRTFIEVRIPSAYASISSGLRTAAVLAVIGSVVADFIAGSSGLGFLVMRSVYTAHPPLFFSSILLCALLGQLIYFAVDLTQRRLDKRFASS